jgi:hypothetical protein
MWEWLIFDSRLPIDDCRLPIELIANSLSFQPLQHDFG